MKKKNKIVYPVPVEKLTHKDRRVNIPTGELRDFVADQEAKPKTIPTPAVHSKRFSILFSKNKTKLFSQ